VKRRDVVLLLCALAIVAVPLLVVKAPAGGEGFGGTDAAAQSLVRKIAPGYEPWFKPIWQPPGTEIASGLFAIQAGLGCGFIGYYVGLSVGRRRRQLEEPTDA